MAQEIDVETCKICIEKLDGEMCDAKGWHGCVAKLLAHIEGQQHWAEVHMVKAAERDRYVLKLKDEINRLKRIMEDCRLKLSINRAIRSNDANL